MNKGMMIFDKPSKCVDCPCCSNDPFGYDLVCNLTKDLIHVDQPIPCNCPIVPLDSEQMDAILDALKRRIERRRL